MVKKDKTPTTLLPVEAKFNIGIPGRLESYNNIRIEYFKILMKQNDFTLEKKIF